MISFCLALAFLIALVMVAVWFLLPAASQAAERARLEREAADASWRIHQRASRAFGQMLDAARRDEDQEGGR